MSKNISELSGRKGVERNLFVKYAKASEDIGTPSKEDLKKLAEEYLIGEASTYGAITAYDFMKPENKGKKAYYCNGSACLCAGTQDEVLHTLLTYFDPSEIGHMTCLGRCHDNSSFHIEGRNYSGNDIHVLSEIIENNEYKSEESYKVYAETQVLTEPFPGIDKFKELLSKSLNAGKQNLLEEIKISNIRGRGGAGFPMGIKWESCLLQESDRKYIICNADEGDPGAYTDRYLLENKPYSIIFGMLIAGYCTGADWGIIYIRGEYPKSVEIMNEAIETLKKENLIGENILGSDFSFRFKVVKAQGAYICGEETALINSLEGQRPEVRTRPPYPTFQGLFNKPTIVNNVETLAAVWWIIEHGGTEYKNLGTEKSSGTKLISLDGYLNKPGIYEVEMGTSFYHVIYELAGGFKSPIKAVHVGGPLGGIIPVEKIKDLSLDFESFGSNSFLLGHASVVSIPESMPMITYLEHLFEFASFESCGKCFPCRLGTRRAYELLNSAAREDQQIDETLFRDLLDTLEQGSLCAHGGGIPLPARNALQYFRSELEPYFA